MTSDSNAEKAVGCCSPEAIGFDQYIIKSNGSRTTAVRTFESDDQTSYRISMSRNYALVSLIKAQSKQFATYVVI